MDNDLLMMDDEDKSKFTTSHSPLKKGYKQTEIGEIPEDWEVVKLGNVVKVISGGTPSTNINEYWGNGTILWATPTDVTKNSKYINDTEKKITLKGLQNSSANLLPKNSILMTSRATIGKCCINILPMATNQGFKSLICEDVSNNEFIYYLLNSMKKKIIKLGNGSTFLEISKKDMENLKIPLPPLPEQQKIAKILTTWDNAIEKKEKLISKKIEYKKGLSNKLLSGKLRFSEFKEEWRVEKLGNVLYEPKKIKIKNPENYELLTVKLHCNGIKKTGKYPKPTKKGRPYFIRYEREILIGRQNFHNGGIGIVPKSVENCIASNAITSLLPIMNCDLKYVIYYISRYDYYKKTEYLIGGTGQKEISKNQLLNLKIHLSSLPEQKKIAEVLSHIDKEINLLKKELSLLKEQKKGLMQNLLTGKIRVKP